MEIVKRFIFFTSFFVSICISEQSIGETNESKKYGGNFIKISSIISTTTTCSSPLSPIEGKSSRSSVHRVYRHGPCSPSWVHEAEGITQGHDQFSEESLLEDQLRVDSIHYILNNKYSKVGVRSKKIELPAKAGISLGTGIGSFVVQVGFGTPTKSMTLMFDTGNDLTWIQCDRQFDSSKSSSYSNIRCKSAECSELKSVTRVRQTCFADSSCRYIFKSGGKVSSGYFAKEKLTLGFDVFKGFKFGCGVMNKGRYGSAAGFLGLGRNNLSLVSQTVKKYGGVFSYCLPSRLSSTGYLSLGREQGKNDYKSVKFTPLFTDRRGPSFYFIKMTAIIVDGRKIPLSSSPSKSANMIIDSGTTISRLPPSAYAALKSAFSNHFSSDRKAQPVSILDTCYNVVGLDLFSIPQISFVFEDDIEVSIGDASVVGGSNASQLCLAFAGNDDPSDVGILGSMQQQQLKIVYDIPQKRLGFGPFDCI